MSNEVQNIRVTEDEADIRLDRWFKRHFPHVPHGYVQRLLRTGQVRVDGGRAKADSRLTAGQTVRVPPLQIDADAPRPAVKREADPRRVAEIRRRILFQDDDVLVIDKPAGLAVQGGTDVTTHLDALLDGLRFDAADRPRLVHRLDKDTSGVLVLARTAKAASGLAESFRSRDARKYYWAITVGVPKLWQGRIDLALAKQRMGRNERVAADEDEGARAVTDYSVVENAGKRAAWVAMWPRTGRTHQLRVHCADGLGTPILGDGKYGGAEAFLPGAEVPRQLHLHARRLILPHPRGRGVIDVTAPLPPHMKASWTYFGFDREDDGDPFADLE